MSAATTEVPDFITPVDVSAFDEAQLETLLEDIRERRLRAVRVYEQALADAKTLADDRARISLKKQIEMLRANLERVDKALAALDDRVQKVRALRLSLGL